MIKIIFPQFHQEYYKRHEVVDLPRNILYITHSLNKRNNFVKVTAYSKATMNLHLLTKLSMLYMN
jgi:hypothetical protein